jgi:exodeoxyribonuclease V alpha subunit
VAVLTGSAGVGKSSITKALYRIYLRCGFNVVLLSPTAKAARRLEECTGGEAKTIHKFLKMTKDGDSHLYEDYIKDTVLIIDEASMMDIILFNNLLKGATMSTRILLVGDNNQLPSVQAGNVLGDTIDSENVHISLLTDIMRQQENSSIIKYCSMINNGEVFEPCENPDFLYEEFGTADELKEKFLPLYKEEVKAVGLNEVQVIAPYKKGELGMNNLNAILQQEMNAKGREALEGFKVGDKVRHTQNNYKKEVFNGETGVILNYDSGEDEMIVDYGDRIVPYNRLDVAELTLSYASTVHASQGSEYKVVFVILDDTSVNSFLHIRRLLYTAVSRGKQKVYILTKPYLVDKCIENNSYRPRITKLKDFLQEV